MWALVPLKILDQVKSRLAPVLNQEERRGLVIAMLEDVLIALGKSTALSGVLLVSRDPQIVSLLSTFTHLQHWQEPERSDLSSSIYSAAEYLKSEFNAVGVMVVPADVPLITDHDIHQLLEKHTNLTLVPDHQLLGTNCLIFSPPNNMPVQFDGRSFQPHLQKATSLGLNPLTVKSSAFSLDVDTPEDLLQLIYRVGDSKTGAYLKKTGIASRILALPNKTNTG